MSDSTWLRLSSLDVYVRCIGRQERAVKHAAVRREIKRGATSGRTKLMAGRLLLLVRGILMGQLEGEGQREKRDRRSRRDDVVQVDEAGRPGRKTSCPNCKVLDCRWHKKSCCTHFAVLVIYYRADRVWVPREA